jgi:uncharacterized LabA/DUF88 family protein
MEKASDKRKVAVYIDGSNFYFSVKKTFGCKLDIEKFCKQILGDHELVKINYYIAPVEQFSNLKMYAEQQSFFEKLKKIDKLSIVFGRLEKRRKDGEVYYIEKASDVNLALDLALDAQKKIYDEAYVVSNDGDFSGAVTSAINFGKKVVYVAVGNKKSISYHLKKVASRTLYVTQEFIDNCKL